MPVVHYDEVNTITVRGVAYVGYGMHVSIRLVVVVYENRRNVLGNFNEVPDVLGRQVGRVQTVLQGLHIHGLDC